MAYRLNNISQLLLIALVSLFAQQQSFANGSQADKLHTKIWDSIIKYKHSGNKQSKADSNKAHVVALDQVTHLHFRGFQAINIVGGYKSSYAVMPTNRGSNSKINKGHAYFVGSTTGTKNSRQPALIIHWAHSKPLSVYANGKQLISGSHLDEIPLSIVSTRSDNIDIAGKNIKLTHLRVGQQSKTKVKGVNSNYLDVIAENRSRVAVAGSSINVTTVSASQNAKVIMKGIDSDNTEIKTNANAMVSLSGDIGVKKLSMRENSQLSLHGINTNILTAYTESSNNLSITGKQIAVFNLQQRGSGTISINKMKAQKVSLGAFSSGKIKLFGFIGIRELVVDGYNPIMIQWIDTPELNIKQIGASKLYLAGFAGKLNALVLHESLLNAQFLNTGKATVITRHKALAKVRSGGSLDALALEQSHVLYYGFPRYENTYMAGQSSVLWSTYSFAKDWKQATTF